MLDEDRLEAAARALSEASSIGELRAAISTWAPRFHDSLNENIRAGSRPEFGIHITRTAGRGGLAARRRGSFLVGLGRQGGRPEHFFTLAHELAHVLFDAIDREALGLDGGTEENLCDLFARRAVAPPTMVSAYLRRAGMPIDLAGIDRFARRFRISLRASLVVLDEVFPSEWPVAFVAASWRLHPRGDEVLGMRIDGSASDARIFLPTHCRLSTLGYHRLEKWALEGELGKEAPGTDGRVELRSLKAGVSAWVGESAWKARRHLAPASRAGADERGVLCELEVDRLSPRPSGRRRLPGSARKLPPVAKVPGQLGF